MTKDTIDMAREAGMVYRDFEDEFANANTDGVDLKTLKAFEALVRADEREQLTNLDWTALMRQGNLVTWGNAGQLGDRVVAAIRARGNI
jgi:hypothetical protein